MILFFSLLTCVSVLSATRKNEFLNPDFAYPADVSAMASDEYASAMVTHNYDRALLAAIELNIADRLTTSDSIAASATRYSDIADMAPEPYASMARLLEARMLSEYYRSDRYTLDSRTLPENSADANPQLWSGSLFKSKISDLCSEVLAQKGALSSCPLSEIALILTNVSDGEKAGMTVFDFACYQIFRILENAGLDGGSDSNLLPFTIGCDDLRVTRPSEKAFSAETLSGQSVIEQLVKCDSISNAAGVHNDEALLRARLVQLASTQSKTMRKKRAEELLRLYDEKSEWRPQVIVDLYQSGILSDLSDNDDTKLYDLLNATIAGHPDSDLNDCIKGFIDSLTLPSINLNAESQWLSGAQGTIYYTLRNASQCRILLVPVSASAVESRMRNLKLSNLAASGKIRELAVINAPHDAPYSLTDSINVPGLTPGYYAIVPSATQDLNGIYSTMRNDYPLIVNVSDISLISSSVPLERTERNSENGRSVKSRQTLYVVDGHNNAPIKGARVTFTDFTARNSTLKSISMTGQDGSVTVPYNNCHVTVEYKGSRISDDLYNYGRYIGGDKNKSASLFTDLAIYHPGDSVNVAVVAVNAIGRSLSPAVNNSLILTLRDANYQAIARDTVTTDSFGRSTASFRIPDSGLTGRFSIGCSDKENEIGSTSFQVADYKAPTFLVTTDKPELPDSGISDCLRISGSVMTYSGMPLAASDVTINITYRTMPWWRIYPIESPKSFAITAVTDENGRFNVSLGMKNLYGGDYDLGVFTIETSAVSPTGEAQSASPVNFSIREGYHLSGEKAITVKADADTIDIPVKVTDSLGKPAIKKVNYKLIADNSNDTVLSGYFDSPSLRFAASEIKSGRYTLQCVLPDALPSSSKRGEMTADTLNTVITIWRDTDPRPPFATSVWIPENELYAADGSKQTAVRVGSRYANSHLFYEVTDLYGVISRGWIDASDENTKLNVPSPAKGNAVKVVFYGMHDLKSESGAVTVYPAVEKKKVEIITETFRDRITPGSVEKWKFRISIATAGAEAVYPAGSAAIAVLSDAALNAITPFEWRYDFRSLLPSPYNAYLNIPNVYKIGFSGNMRALKRHKGGCGTFENPAFNTWDYPLGGYMGGVRLRGTRLMQTSGNNKYASAMAKGEAIESETVYEMAADSDAAPTAVNGYAKSAKIMEDMSEGNSSDLNNGSSADKDWNISLRETSCPLAFFRPDLVADSEGNVEIEFESPDFNTTWQFQMVAYTPDMKGNVLRKNTMAAKAVMISSNAPRFLLTGDKATIDASIFNNTDNTLAIGALLEVYDASDGKVLAKREFSSEELNASASRTITIDFDVPDNINAVGLRAMARSERGSDGEQTLISVLPSSAPVIDSETFYLLPGEKNYSLKLPTFKKGDQITLNFCANPAWYALANLSPALNTDSESALAITDALCANGISEGLLKSYPTLRAALAKLFNGDGRDSLLVSPLEKNQNMKIASLGETPWVNNAESQTLRMQSLYTLLDNDGVNYTRNQLISKLSRTQNPDGAWSWMKKMPSSLYITCRVLTALGNLKSSGYMPESSELDAMLKSGLSYADAAMSKEYHDAVYKYKSQMSLTSEINYFLMRGNLTDATANGDLAAMHKDMLKRLPAEWRQLNLYDKATAAIILMRNGKNETAAEIMESVRQFASYKDNKGMWFDNREGVYGHSSESLTAHCLEALRLTKPSDKETLSKMTQYLVLGLQTQDIYNANSVSETSLIVNAILAGMPSWTESDLATPKISIDGKEISVPDNMESLTGSFYINLEPLEVSGKILSVARQGEGPAWGGVMSSRIAEISTVKAASVPQLKVTKSLLPVSIEENRIKAGMAADKFSKGEKIRVTLTLVCDRNLDYVMISDSRGAWMQPSDQLTEYYATDGLWILRETRNESTNFYITSLPKGKYVISYDVTADRDGEYSTGIASAQSIYYPLITAHSAGCMVEVR